VCAFDDRAFETYTDAVSESQDWLGRPQAVSFDCWATLLYETKPAPETRVRILSEFAGAGLVDCRAALAAAWRQHQISWHRRVAFTAVDMTHLALQILDKRIEPDRTRQLIEAMETEVLGHQVCALEGSRELLRGLARAGVRRALICDTGFTPGRVVRQLLERVGLLEYLELTIFSDEVGAPKPEAKLFRAVLDEFGVAPTAAVHVGDLRRSDVAGARNARMGSVRLRAYHDDGDGEQPRRAGVIDCVAAGCTPACDRPEADLVVDSHWQLFEPLGLGSDAA
jgi:putative hydrolase of the HAD superfamily